jgi:hypothetical protein
MRQKRELEAYVYQGMTFDRPTTGCPIKDRQALAVAAHGRCKRPPSALRRWHERQMTKLRRTHVCAQCK